MFKPFLSSDPKSGFDKFNICLHQFSCKQNGSVLTFVHAKLRVYKTITIGANLHCLIYNVLIDVIFPIYLTTC